MKELRHKLIIALSDADQCGWCGHWGKGNTLREAEKALRKAGGKVKDCKIYLFFSDLPFAPSGRDATEDESDAYVSKEGWINWIRCERICLTEIEVAS